MANDTPTSEVNSTWKPLYKAGGIAALAAGLIFRRNLGAEISLFSQIQPPSNVDVSGWFTLLVENKWLALAYLSMFDLINYALVGLMFMALFAALYLVQKSAAAVGLACALVGAGVYFASNTAFNMLALSHQYLTVETEGQKSALLGAGQAMLAYSDLSGTGMLVSLFLVALAGLIAAMLILRSKIFSKATAVFIILASALDLAYCIAIPFVPAGAVGMVALVTIPAAGLFLMIWHILAGWRLFRLGRS